MADIVNKKSRDRQTLASHIKDTAVIVETGIVNVIMAASFSARVEPGINDSHLSFNTTREKVIFGYEYYNFLIDIIKRTKD